MQAVEGVMLVVWGGLRVRGEGGEAGGERSMEPEGQEKGRGKNS